MRLKFCIIGAGNLATHLAPALHAQAGEVIQLYSRTEKNARELAGKLNCAYTTSATEITLDADIYFVALKDSAVTEVLSYVNLENKLIVHTSGSLSLSVLEIFSENYGVFYPLQTFSKNRTVDFRQIPIFIEANNRHNEQRLVELSRQISEKVFVIDSLKRKSLHIAAVFVCNFVNHFYALADDYLKKQNIPFDVLRLLITETAEKVQKLSPREAQTGPAVRFDENIIDDHLKTLEAYPEMQTLYKLISKSIFEYHQKK